MSSKIKKMELVGKILILSSFFAHVFILLSIQSLANDAVRYKTERKIDILYNIERDNYQKLHPEVQEPYFIANPSTFNDYKYAENNEELESVKNQILAIRLLVATIFIIGSLYIIAAKYYEYLEAQTNE